MGWWPIYKKRFCWKATGSEPRAARGLQAVSDLRKLRLNMRLLDDTSDLSSSAIYGADPSNGEE